MKDLFGTQVYPWLQYYKAEGRNWKDHLPEILDQVKEAGLDAWEQSIGSEAEADRLSVLLQYRDLEMVSIYAGGRFHEDDFEKTIQSTLAQARFAKPLGVRYVVCNPTPISWSEAIGKNDEQLAIQAKALQLLGEGLVEQGMQLSYHVHTPELRNGAREFHHMMLNVSPEAMGLCLETHWLFRGCGDSNLAVLDVMKLYGDRINTTHLRQSQNSIWDETFREGDLDHEEIFRRLGKLDYSGPLTFEMAIEDGTPKTMSHVEAHRRAKEYLQGILTRS